MKLFDIYKHKKTNELIQIDSFANRMNIFDGELMIVFRNIEYHGDGEYGSCATNNGYGTSEEIEKEYELFIKQEDLKKYNSYKEIYDLLKENNDEV